MQLLCPLCQQPLNQTDKRWHCINLHSFDIAKQGYCNLLPVQKKKSRSPGDDKQMVIARRQFLNSDYYQPVTSAINQLIIAELKNQHLDAASLIDAGCGEGYYSHSLIKAITHNEINCEIIATDISKPAIIAATQRSQSIRWFVANSNQLPVNNHSADALLSLFAPNYSEEFYRCLKKNGLLLVASTGPQHLIELRQLLYDTIKATIHDPTQQLQQHFTALNKINVYEKLQLHNNDVISDLLAMTPHYWRSSPTRKQALKKLDKLSVTVDIQLHCLRAKTI